MPTNANKRINFFISYLVLRLFFIYVFFLKVGEVLGAVAGVNSLVYVWIPNFIFGLLALYLYLNAKK